MTISTKGRYALRLMIDIAEHGENGNVPLKEIARRQDISGKYLEQIVNLLCKSGLLKSTRGAGGGYQLTKSAKDYTLGDILRVTEGNLVPVSCLEDNPNRCSRASQCKTIDFWSGLYKVINEYVDSVSLADMKTEIEYNI